MTDWIEELAKQLNDEQKQQNAEYAAQKETNQFIDSNALKFFQIVSTDVVRLADELDWAVGGCLNGVKAEATLDSFTVTNGRGNAGTTMSFASSSPIVAAKFDKGARAIVIKTSHKDVVHRRFGRSLSTETYHFRKSGDQLVVEHEGENRTFDDPSQLATAIVMEAFQLDLFG